MAVLQTAYTDQVAPGYAGMVANGETSNRITRTIEDALGVAFGKPVYAGTGDHGCTLTGTAASFLGITIAHETLGLVAGQAADTFPVFASVPIMTQGVIWAVASVSVTKRDPVYATAAGAFTNVATSNVALTGWVFDTTAASGALVKLAKR